MKRIAALLWPFLCVAPLNAAPASETPVLKVFKQWLEAFNSGDTGPISAFWKKYGGNSPADRVERDQQLRDLTGGMTIFRVVEDNGTHLVVLMKENRGAWSESTLDLGSTDPPIVSKMTGHPVPAPEGAQIRASKDEDIAALVQAHAAGAVDTDAFSGAILVAHHGQILLSQAWGMADSAKQIRNTADTQFCIGSMNKMFTAAAILQLVQQGKLTLDRPIINWWPDYPNRDLASRVTIRQLLSHTGGTGDIFTPEYEAHREETRTLADYVRLFGNRSVAFEPGTRMEYSNYGFILLGRIIELVSGESYDNYVHKHIFIPAGMTRTDARPESEHPQFRAIGYVRKPEGLVPNTGGLPWSGTSAGGGYSTVHDLFLFAQALQAGLLLSPELLAEATNAGPQRRDYGLGFYVLPEGGFGHGGGAPGINGELHILPRNGYVIVALANRDPRMATNMVDFVASILPEESASVLPASR